MSDFSREAMKLLRAAEDALSGKRTAMTKASSEKLGDGCNDVLEEMRDSWPLLELQRQLRTVMTEVKNLRSELTAERESRSQTIALLGRRWKEEMLVEIRAAENQSRRAISELEINIQRQQKEEAVARALVQRQLDDITRGGKVKERSQFEQHEYIQEQLTGFRERLEATVAECGLLRVESAQQLEKERASLAHRLDAELLRYVDMRREEQREREALKQQMKADIAAFGRNVKDLVAESWRTHAAALERTLREPIEGFARQMARHDEVVGEMNAKIHDCTTTCRAEVRLHGASLQERVSALEAAGAVTVSRVDRAERKADAAQEAVSRADASVSVARETAEGAAAQARRAIERAQRMEDTVQDRDTRLAQLETQLGAVATAEKLRAEIEGVRRAAIRAESGVDALRQVCERSEQLAEHTRRGVDGHIDRIDGCEQLVQRLRSALECVEGRLPPLQQRIAVLEEAREALILSNTRTDDSLAVISQRVHVTEGSLRGLCERLEQTQRDALSGQQALNTRLEHASDMALRCETSSATARAEVDRMSRRVCDLEAQASRISADCVAFRSSAEDYLKKVVTLSDRLQQMREWQEQRETCMDAAISALETQNSTVLGQTSGRLESKLQRDVNRLQTTFEERAAAVEMLVEKEVKLLQDQIAKPHPAFRGNDDAVQRLAREMQECKIKIESLNTAFGAVSDTINEGQKGFALQSDCDALRKRVLMLESQIRAISADIEVQQQIYDDVQAKLRQAENERRRQRVVEHEEYESQKEVRDEKHVSCSISQSVSVTPAVNRRIQQSTAASVAANQISAAPRTTTNITEKEVLEGTVEQGAEEISSVAFLGANALDLLTNNETTSGKFATFTLPLSTDQNISSRMSTVQGHHEEVSDAQPVSPLQESSDDSVQRGSGSRRPITASQRFTTFRGDVAGRPLVKAWGVEPNSDAKTVKAAEKRADVQQVRDVSLLVSSAADECDRGIDNDTVVTNDVRGMAVQTTFMKPSIELSNTAADSCDGITLLHPAGLLKQHSDDSSTAHKSSSSAVEVFASDKKRIKSDSSLLVDNAAAIAKEAAPQPRNMSWYNEWDDSSTTDVATPARQVGTDESAINVEEFESAEKILQKEKRQTLSSQEHLSHGNESVAAVYTDPDRVFMLHQGSVSKDTSSYASSDKKRKKSSDVAQKRFTSFDDSTTEEENL